MITSDDAHAWVEVYFQGLGWVPFDPTPISAERAVDLPWAPRADAATGTAAAARPPRLPPTGAAAPTNGRTAPATPRRVAQRAQAAAGTSWPLLAGAGAVLVLWSHLRPAGVRAVQRRRRLAAGTAGALWDELVATALDVGVRLQPAWTPRRAAQELAAGSGAGRRHRDGRAADAVARLARAEEVACYGRAGGTGAEPELVTALRAARRGCCGRVARRRLRARAVAGLAGHRRGPRGRRGGPAALREPDAKPPSARAGLEAVGYWS